MDWLATVQLLGGLALLVLGAEWLVRGSVRLAGSIGMSPLVVGLTVVAFGTSSPEFAVSLLSAYGGQADLALGNVVGSNIANVLLILGASALVTPLAVKASLVRLDVPLMILASGLVLALGLDGRLGRGDGAVLAGGVVAYTVFQFRQGKRESDEVREEFEREYAGRQGRTGRALLLTLMGLVLLVLGSRWLVEGAILIARGLGVSDLVVGLTVVAIGTSLPELATSVVAAAKGERDIAVGNIVGSNLFNLLAVLGPTAVLAPAGIDVPAAALRFDLPVMLGVAVVCLPVFASGHLVARWEGGLFVAGYCVYLLYLGMNAAGHPALALLGFVITWIALPATVLALVVAWLRGRADVPRGGS